MPTSTFFNLNQEKREKVIAAVKKEFKRTQLINMSVKNIVQDSNIARGSFYQYFTTREDLIEYIIEEEYTREMERVKKFLIKNSGDVFNTAYDYLVSTLDISAQELDYYIHIAEYLKDFELRKIKSADIEEMKKYINCDDLSINSEEEFRAALTIISVITIFTRISILQNILKKEEGLRRYKIELEVLKKGFLKEKIK